jgi:hypothetical protein
MPNGNGGSLPAPTYRDLVAMILRANGFPAGTTELAPETIVGVQIIPKDGPGELPGNTLVRIVGCLAKNGNDWVLTTATTPERVEKTGVGPEDATRQLGDSDDDAQVRADPPRPEYRETDVGQRHPDRAGRQRWHQRHHGQPGRRNVQLKRGWAAIFGSLSPRRSGPRI